MPALIFARLDRLAYSVPGDVQPGGDGISELGVHMVQWHDDNQGRSKRLERPFGLERGPMTIRAAAMSDTVRMREIYGDAVLNGTATYELETPGQAEMDARFAALWDGGFPVLVAEISGRVAGYAYAGPFRPRPAYRFTVEDSIYLAPEARGQRVGTRLLERLVDESRKLGFRQIAAVIGDGSPLSASVRLHEKLGFTHCGMLAGSGYKHGRWLDTVFMQLALNGGSTMPPDPQSLPEQRFRGQS